MRSGLALEKGTTAPLVLKTGAPPDCSMPLPGDWMTVVPSVALGEIQGRSAG